MSAEASRQAVERFWRAMNTNDWRAVGELLHDDYVLEWPQSNERIRGAELDARMNREYVAHGRWRVAIVRLFGDTTDAVSEVDVTDGVQRAKAISFFACREGRIVRLVEFWPEPFAARADRAHLVEPIEPRAQEP